MQERQLKGHPSTQIWLEFKLKPYAHDVHFVRLSDEQVKQFDEGVQVSQMLFRKNAVPKHDKQEDG